MKYLPAFLVAAYVLTFNSFGLRSDAGRALVWTGQHAEMFGYYVESIGQAPKPTPHINWPTYHFDANLLLHPKTELQHINGHVGTILAKNPLSTGRLTTVVNPNPRAKSNHATLPKAVVVPQSVTPGFK